MTYERQPRISRYEGREEHESSHWDNGKSWSGDKVEWIESHGAIPSRVSKLGVLSMRIWKLTTQSLLIVSLVMEGMLAANWIYNARGAGENYQCQQITCSNVMSGSSNCPSTVWCASTSTATQFWKCMPVTGYYCVDSQSNGSIQCAGTCQNMNGNACFYTLYFCK